MTDPAGAASADHLQYIDSLSVLLLEEQSSAVRFFQQGDFCLEVSSWNGRVQVSEVQAEVQNQLWVSTLIYT